MTSERNNTALEFETMLRRHLKSGGAPVAACAGFDFDTASAYLEDALGKPDRAGYEAHLAGCAACRRHLIELSRLARAVAPAGPRAETKPAQVADQIPAWIRWRKVVAGWFDLSGWDWKWQMVGAAGATFAILIAALGVQSWRQASEQPDGAIMANTSAPGALESKVQSPAPEASPQSAQSAGAVNLTADYQAGFRASVPSPPSEVGPKEGQPNVAVAPAGESLILNSSQPSLAPSSNLAGFSLRQDAPAEIRRGVVETQQNPAPQQGLATLLDSSDNADRQVLAKLRAESQEQAPDSPAQVGRNEMRNDITARITPPPGINPMNSEPKPGPRGRLQTEKSSPQPSKRSLYDIAMRFVPGSKAETGRKAKPEALDDESFKPLTVRIRDKVFRFEGNMWIDQAYKPEMQWRVLKLTRGSKQYEQVLSADPLLKEFFDQGPILVIWKDKIYKVR